tara:strand:- start:503 stop:907 length:405 start_codon:yes stop_codon:yes gene_type:complete
MENIILDWSHVYRLLDNIHNQVDDKIKYVTGIPRGGTILAILYSHKFNVKYLHSPSNGYPNLLILDDISDSGETLENISTSYFNNLTATLYYKEGSIKKPNFYSEYIPKNYGWIIFPWENKNADNIQDYLKYGK